MLRSTIVYSSAKLLYIHVQSPIHIIEFLLLAIPAGAFHTVISSYSAMGNVNAIQWACSMCCWDIQSSGLHMSKPNLSSKFKFLLMFVAISFLCFLGNPQFELLGATLESILHFGHREAVMKRCSVWSTPVTCAARRMTVKAGCYEQTCAAKHRCCTHWMFSGILLILSISDRLDIYTGASLP